MSFQYMFNYILTGECFISDATIGNPTCHLCSKFYVQIGISVVKSRQISNIHTHGFLLKFKNQFDFNNGPIKIVEKTIKTLSWNYCIIFSQSFNHVWTTVLTLYKVSLRWEITKHETWHSLIVDIMSVFAIN